MNLFNSGLSFLVTGAAIAGACGCYTPNPMPRFSPQHMSHRVELPDISFFIEPIDTEQECEIIFKENVNKKGYLPFVFVIQNNSSEEIRIPRGGIEFVSEFGPWEQASGQEVARKYKTKGKIATTVSPGVVKPFVLVKSWNETLEREEDYQRKIMPSQMRIGGRSDAQGMVIFCHPQRKDAGNYSGTYTTPFYQKNERREITINLKK